MKPAWALLLLALGVFTALTLPHIRQPIAQDELHHLIGATSLYETGTALQYGSTTLPYNYSPELYLQMLHFVFRLFGEGESVARLPGIGSAVLSILMVFGMTKSFAEGTAQARLQWASLVSLAYALTPGVIQGALILDIDNTILVPAVLLLCWSFSKCLQTPRVGWAILCGLAMTIALWGRITTPPVLGLLMGTIALASNGTVKSKATVLGALLGGTLVFLISWYGYCSLRHVSFSGPFLYAFHAFMGKSKSLTQLQFAQNALSVLLWGGVFHLLMLVIAIKSRAHSFFAERKAPPEDIFLVCGLCILLGYLFVGGVTFGYPKYHLPAFPLLYIFAGITFSRAFGQELDLTPRKLRVAAILTLLACAIQLFTIGDWLYVFRYQLREQLAFAPVSFAADFRETGRNAVLWSAAYFFLFLFARRISHVPVLGLLYLFALGSSLGVTLLQAGADYSTGYNYGGRGTVETAAYVRVRVPPDTVVIAPGEVSYYLNSPNPPHWSNTIWTDPVLLRKRLADSNTSGFVYSIATNTIEQIQVITGDQAIQEILRRHYDRARVGTYIIWLRKGRPVP